MMQMPPTLSRIFGWEPPSDDGYVEVDVPSQSSGHQLPAFHMSDSAMEPCSPASSTSALSDDQADRPIGSGKKGDPNWVARPRNEFILFRCDYVRKHTKEGGNKRSRRAPGQEAEKTLSKLAAEAWRALSNEERAYWREQANLERNDHARKYPDYRYRPKKSVTARKRQSRSSMATHVVTRSMPAPAIVDPVTVSRSPSYDPAMTVVKRGGGPLYSDNTIRKATSVPVLPSTRPSDWMSLSAQPIQNSFDSRMSSVNVNTYHQHFHPLQHSQSYDSLNLATPALSETMSIPDSTSSSLINWNAESPLLAPQPTQFIDPLNLPLHASFTSDSMQSPMRGIGQQRFLNAVSGGQPQLNMHDPLQQQQQPSNNDAQWGGVSETMYLPQAPAVGGMPIMRTSSQHSLNFAGAEAPNQNGNGLQLYDMGEFGVFKSPGMGVKGQQQQFHHQMPPMGVTVVPSEYLMGPARIVDSLNPLLDVFALLSRPSFFGCLAFTITFVLLGSLVSHPSPSIPQLPSLCFLPDTSFSYILIVDIYSSRTLGHPNLLTLYSLVPVIDHSCRIRSFFTTRLPSIQIGIAHQSRSLFPHPTIGFTAYLLHSLPHPSRSLFPSFRS